MIPKYHIKKRNKDIKKQVDVEIYDVWRTLSLTQGGRLSVSFEVFNGTYRNIWLSGEASMVYAGEFEC